MLPDKQTNLLYSVIGEEIREKRKEKGKKQKEFADLLNISRASLINIEKGRQRPPLHLLYSIAETLDINVNDLLPSREELNVTDEDQRLKNQARKLADGNKELEEKLLHFMKTANSDTKNVDQ